MSFGTTLLKHTGLPYGDTLPPVQPLFTPLSCIYHLHFSWSDGPFNEYPVLFLDFFSLRSVCRRSKIKYLDLFSDVVDDSTFLTLPKPLSRSQDNLCVDRIQHTRCGRTSTARPVTYILRFRDSPPEGPLRLIPDSLSLTVNVRTNTSSSGPF